MNVLVVSGIWPPDVGGPASHAPEFAEYLRARGHDVAVVTTADREPAREAYRVHWTSRRWPRGARHLLGAVQVAVHSRAADVVYSTGLLGRTALGSALTRTPFVYKLTSDPTYERSVYMGLTRDSLEHYQESEGTRIALLRRMRNAEIARAAHLVCPSESLREFAISWGVPRERVTLLPNPVSAPAQLEERDALRRRHGFDGPTLAFAGRLSVQKSIDVALEALTKTNGVRLVLAGDGPDREQLQRRARELGLDGRAQFLGPQPRQTVFELLRAADAALLSSSWENFPHMVVEALAVGTPVVATEIGGVPEIVRDGENGLLVPVGDAEALAAAIERYLADGELQARLRAAAPASVERFAPEKIYARLEEILVVAAG